MEMTRGIKGMEKYRLIEKVLAEAKKIVDMGGGDIKFVCEEYTDEKRRKSDINRSADQQRIDVV